MPVVLLAVTGFLVYSGMNLVDRLIAGSRKYSWYFRSEKEMQDRFEDFLKAEGIEYSREHNLSDTDRPDFMIGSTVLEVKTNVGLEKHLRQLARYAKHTNVTNTVLVSTRPIDMPPQLFGKPTAQVVIRSSFL